MTNTMTEHLDLSTLDTLQLHARYNQLKGSAPANELPESTLHELLAITRVLRRRAAPGPKKATKAPPPGLDAL